MLQNQSKEKKVWFMRKQECAIFVLRTSLVESAKSKSYGKQRQWRQDFTSHFKKKKKRKLKIIFSLQTGLHHEAKQNLLQSVNICTYETV